MPTWLTFGESITSQDSTCVGACKWQIAAAASILCTAAPDPTAAAFSSRAKTSRQKHGANGVSAVPLPLLCRARALRHDASPRLAEPGTPRHAPEQAHAQNNAGALSRNAVLARARVGQGQTVLSFAETETNGIPWSCARRKPDAQPQPDAALRRFVSERALTA
eukprot:193828-Rhodomonas_salina.2